MITVKNLSTLLKLPSIPQEGDLACLTDENNKIMCYGKNGWAEVKPEGDIQANLYELNATAIAQMPAHGPMDFAQDINLINEFIEEFDGVYFNLLCKQLANGAFYNTIFRRVFDQDETMGQAVISCVRELGTIHAISNEETHIEIWVKEPEEHMTCLLFFNCDSMVIEVK